MNMCRIQAVLNMIPYENQADKMANSIIIFLHHSLSFQSRAAPAMQALVLEYLHIVNMKIEP